MFGIRKYGGICVFSIGNYGGFTCLGYGITGMYVFGVYGIIGDSSVRDKELCGIRVLGI